MSIEGRRPSLTYMDSSVDFGDFFDFARVQLPNVVLDSDPASSSDETTLTSGNDENTELPNDASNDLQRQISTLTIQTNVSSRKKPSIPSKYLIDETGRRWSTKAMYSGDIEAFPCPKHQSGRSKLPTKASSNQLTLLELWQLFMPDKFLEMYAVPWLNKFDGDLQHQPDKRKTKGKTEQVFEKVDLPILDELKAMVALLYARFASTDGKTPFEDSWTLDCLTPSFFAGTMEKDKFFDLLKSFLGLDMPPQPLSQCNVVPSFLNDFNYRMIQTFDPGDALAIVDRTITSKVQMVTSPVSSLSGERVISRKATISWLRDVRSGYYLKLAPPVYEHIPDMIVGLNDTIGKAETDKSLKYLLDQAPIMQSGRTVYVGPRYASVACARSLYRENNLRFIGQLPLSGSRDHGVPSIAKSRKLLKRTIGSSIFLFDYPLSLISYQRQSPNRHPDVLISTAHFSKDKSATTISDAVQDAENSEKTPSAWLDYQRVHKDLSNRIDSFIISFLEKDAIKDLPMERSLFLDCLYASAFNAFILWELQQVSYGKEETLDKIYRFRLFLRRLSCYLAKPYIEKRLALASDGNKVVQLTLASVIGVMLQDVDSNLAANSNSGKSRKMDNRGLTEAEAMGGSASNHIDTVQEAGKKKFGKGRGKCKK